MIYAHRNLNAAKRDWSKYVYSYGPLKGSVGRGKVSGHTERMTLTNVSANCQRAALKRIHGGEYRSVSAWLIGTPADMPSGPHNARRFSINPKVGEYEFRWSDTKEPVQFPLKCVELRSDGTYSIS